MAFPCIQKIDISVEGALTRYDMGISQNKGYHFGGPYNKNYSNLGSILGSPYLDMAPICPYTSPYLPMPQYIPICPNISYSRGNRFVYLSDRAYDIKVMLLGFARVVCATFMNTGYVR